MATDEIKKILAARVAALVPVKFLRRYQNYNVGETAGFAKELSAKLVEAGVAEAVDIPKATKKKNGK